MHEVWLHFGWPVWSDRPVIFGAHRTKESARGDCPADVWDKDADWITEGVAPLGRDEYLLAGLEPFVGLMKEIDEPDLGCVGPGWQSPGRG